jgi:hypothetical protein
VDHAVGVVLHVKVLTLALHVLVGLIRMRTTIHVNVPRIQLVNIVICMMVMPVLMKIIAQVVHISPVCVIHVHGRLSLIVAEIV